MYHNLKDLLLILETMSWNYCTNYYRRVHFKSLSEIADAFYTFICRNVSLSNENAGKSSLYHVGNLIVINWLSRSTNVEIVKTSLNPTA